MFNVFYKDSGVTKKYLLDNVTEDIAKAFAKKLHDRYVGKPYPNGKGFYDISDIEVRKA